MSFTYPERVRRLIDLPNVTNGTWIYRPGKARRSRRPPRDEPELIERQRTAGHRVRGRLADPHRAVALVEARRVRVSQDRQPLGAAPTSLGDGVRE